jgi:hypothetical protein
MTRGASPKSFGVGWLHNMSVAPRTTITYQNGPGRAYGEAWVFRLPPAERPFQPTEILRMLVEADNTDSGPGERLPRQEDAETELCARINAHATELPLPAAAVVRDREFAGDREINDLLSVVTVLAKSSGYVYLRDKHPNLAAIRPGRRVVVLAPPRRDS